MIQTELSVCKQLLLRGDRIIIPYCLRQDILQRLHHGHQGVVKCKLCARCSVWWSGILKHKDHFNQQCPTCSKDFQINVNL